jgi:hypothetical protein
MRMHARPKELPDDASMLRQWKRWESGEHMPGEFYQPLIAAAFGIVTSAVFPTSGAAMATRRSSPPAEWTP